MPKVQQLYDACRATFLAGGIPSAESVQIVKNILDTIEAEDVGMESHQWGKPELQRTGAPPSALAAALALEQARPAGPASTAYAAAAARAVSRKAARDAHDSLETEAAPLLRHKSEDVGLKGIGPCGSDSPPCTTLPSVDSFPLRHRGANWRRRKGPMSADALAVKWEHRIQEVGSACTSYSTMLELEDMAPGSFGGGWPPALERPSSLLDRPVPCHASSSTGKTQHGVAPHVSRTKRVEQGESKGRRMAAAAWLLDRLREASRQSTGGRPATGEDELSVGPTTNMDRFAVPRIRAPVSASPVHLHSKGPSVLAGLWPSRGIGGRCNERPTPEPLHTPQLQGKVMPGPAKPRWAAIPAVQGARLERPLSADAALVSTSAPDHFPSAFASPTRAPSKTNSGPVPFEPSLPSVSGRSSMSAPGLLEAAAAAAAAIPSTAVRQMPQPGAVLRQKAPPITYLHVYGCREFSIGIFCLPTNATIPLHNHPGMTVLSRLLFGTMHVRSFDWVDGDEQDPGPAGASSSLMPLDLLETCAGAGLDSASAAPRLARLVEDETISAPCGTNMLFPETGGNIHAFTALSPCAVLDVLAPPYDVVQGRNCTYFREITTPPVPLPGLGVSGNGCTENPDPQRATKGVWKGRRKAASFKGKAAVGPAMLSDASMPAGKEPSALAAESSQSVELELSLRGPGERPTEQPPPPCTGTESRVAPQSTCQTVHMEEATAEAQPDSEAAPVVRPDDTDTAPADTLEQQSQEQRKSMLRLLEQFQPPEDFVVSRGTYYGPKIIERKQKLPSMCGPNAVYASPITLFGMSRQRMGPAWGPNSSVDSSRGGGSPMLSHFTAVDSNWPPAA